MNFESLNNSQELKKENLLLKGPELVEIGKETDDNREMSFSFSSDNRRYYLGYKDGAPFLSIKIYDRLPDEISSQEEKFNKRITKNENGEDEINYFFELGDVPSVKKETEYANPTENKKYRIFNSRDYERTAIEKFIHDQNNKKNVCDILKRYSKLESIEIQNIVDKIFINLQGGNRDRAKNLITAFSKKAIHQIQRKIKENLPTANKIKKDVLIEILKNKKVLFYTGAGVSMASGIPNMEQLEDLLGINLSEKNDEFLEEATKNPQQVLDKWQGFIDLISDRPATQAHEALGFLAKKIGAQIFTENVDDLQEKTGVQSVHLTGEVLTKSIKPEWLKKINYVVTVGLSYDDRGFLGWYKENNPDGKIIAINPEDKLPYLGKEDFILKGDCQEILPSVKKEFKDD